MSNSIPFIDLDSQYRDLESNIDNRIKAVLNHGQYIMGPEVAELEQALAQFTGAKHCISVASGTDALLISLMALGIQSGDEVITTPFTFIATAEVIVLLGAIPIFVDIEPDTCNIDVSKVEAAVTKKTKAIIPVSLYGQPADMTEINAIAENYNLVVIEDSAQSFGAQYKGKKSNNLSEIGCTSFFPSKPLGCYGDGGAIFTSNDSLAQACKEIRVHGQSSRYVHTRIGVGGRMDTIQSAILLAKLDRFDWEVEQRNLKGRHYNNLLDSAKIKRVQQKGDRTSVFAQYTIFVDDREKVQTACRKEHIPTAVHYPVPINEQPAYVAISGQYATPIASECAKQVLSLPISADIKMSDQNRIVDCLEKLLN